MIKKIILGITLSLVLIIFIRTNTNELFVVQFTNVSSNKIGHHKVVSTDEYDHDLEGPKCLSTCIMEHVPNINWRNPDKTDKLLKFNIDNPNKGYCYRANDDKFPFKCETTDCRDRCGKVNTDYDMDFSQCIHTPDLGCVEKNLNISTGHALLHSVGCKICVPKYKENIDNLLQIYKEEELLSNQCSISD
jgi:hypothetical protein